MPSQFNQLVKRMLGFMLLGKSTFPCVIYRHLIESIIKMQTDKLFQMTNF